MKYRNYVLSVIALNGKDFPRSYGLLLAGASGIRITTFTSQKEVEKTKRSHYPDAKIYELVEVKPKKKKKILRGGFLK